ncbi:MAG: TRAP transporter small permease [Dehalococcoidia bacterium]
MDSALNGFERFTSQLSEWFNWVALIALVAMLAFVTVDIVGAKLFKSPVPGAVEIVSFLGVFIAAFAIAKTYLVGRHIRVDFILMRVPARVQRILSCITSLLSMVLFVLIIWRTILYAHALEAAGELSLTLNLPFVPFVYGVAVACVPVFLLLLGQFLRSLIEVKRT